MCSLLKLSENAEKYLWESIEEFYAESPRGALANVEGMEMACAFRIGSSFRLKVESDEMFSGYHVDMEYNKMGRGKQRAIKEIFVIDTDHSTDRRRPDLILHKRGCRKNILICEFKIKNQESIYNEDIGELVAATKSVGRRGYVWGYKTGVFVELENEFNATRAGIRIFRNGTLVPQK